MEPSEFFVFEVVGGDSFLEWFFFPYDSVHALAPVFFFVDYLFSIIDSETPGTATPMWTSMRTAHLHRPLTFASAVEIVVSWLSFSSWHFLCCLFSAERAPSRLHRFSFHWFSVSMSFSSTSLSWSLIALATKLSRVFLMSLMMASVSSS